MEIIQDTRRDGRLSLLVDNLEGEKSEIFLEQEHSLLRSKNELLSNLLLLKYPYHT